MSGMYTMMRTEFKHFKKFSRVNEYHFEKEVQEAMKKPSQTVILGLLPEVFFFLGFWCDCVRFFIGLCGVVMIG